MRNATEAQNVSIVPPPPEAPAIAGALAAVWAAGADETTEGTLPYVGGLRTA